MKTKHLPALLFGVILLIACQHSIDENSLLSESVVLQTRSITQTISPWFDWEDTTIIASPFHGNILLPWYNAASVQLPDFILKDYKKEDGWKMTYNTISSSPITEFGKNYLMFYNRFTGILRIYYYHTNSAGSATTTFWRLAFDRPLSTLNASGYFTHPMDWRPSAPEVYVSTINTVPAKSIYRGWNCFDVELCYDNQLALAPTKMSIAAYSLSESNIYIRGGIKLSSEGSIVTKGNSNEWLKTASKVLNNTSQGAGKVVMDTIQKKISNLEMLPKIGASAALAFASGGVSEAVRLGINLLAGSFFGKMGNPTTTVQDLRFKTNGTADFTGSMTTISGSEITPIATWLYPGLR